MAKITSIGLENYRVFRENTLFNISPITILTGPNSSGKSSLFKALLLLKNNSAVNSLWKLDFSGSTHRLGTFETIKNSYSFKEDLLQFNFEFELMVENTENTFSPIITNRPTSTVKGVKLTPFETTSGVADRIGLMIGYKEDRDLNSGKLVELELYSVDTQEKYISINLSENREYNHSLSINVEAFKDSPFFQKIVSDSFSLNRRIYKSIEQLDLEISPFINSIELNKKIFTDDFAKIIAAFDIEISKTHKTHSHAPFLNSLLNDSLSPLLSIVGYFEYIEAFRANTRRIYTNDSQGTSFNELLLDFSNTSLTKEGESFINKWLKVFKIADKVVFRKIEGVANTIYLKKGDKETLLADLGFGITQFLPILMKIALQEPSNPNKKMYSKPIQKLILLEEPETNLHPKFQSLVAEMISDALQKFEIRFIIETHSEYLIRKLQLLTVKKILMPQDSCIYYIHDLDEKPDHRDQVEKLLINDDGTLDGEFGKGFFDEANSIIGKIWES